MHRVLRGRREVLEQHAGELDPVATTWVTASELFYGAAKSAKPDATAALVIRLLDTLPVLAPDLASARLFGEAMRFVDPSLIDANRALAEAAWREHYGEPLPPAQKPGRKPIAPLEERVIAMLSKAELARLDAARGERSRSEFLRDAARRLVEAVEQQKAG